MISDWVEHYLIFQILISFSIGFIWLFNKKFEILSAKELLLTSYLFVILSFLSPFVVKNQSNEALVTPFAKIWTEPLTQDQKTKIIPNVNFQVPKTTVSKPISGTIPDYLIYGLFFGLFLFVSRKVVVLAGDIKKIHAIKNQSFLYKKIGKVRIWLHPELSSPFSFFDGKAHVFLPESVVLHRQNLKISLLHELQHHRQRDTHLALFWEGVKLIVFPNPLLTVLENQINELQELACDEALVGHKAVSPKRYGECLVDLAREPITPEFIPKSALGMALKPNLLKRRVKKMFTQQRKTTKFKKALTIGFVIFGLLSTGWTMSGTLTNQTLTLEQAKVLAEKANQSREIPIVVNKRVLKWLNRAIKTERSRRQSRVYLARMDLYKNMIEEKMLQYDMPKELFAIPFIESGYNNEWVSSAAAAGIWQFIPGTARRYGLIVNDKIDERRNPEKLTHAAFQYFKHNMNLFDDWHLAMISYNMGENRVYRTLKKAGHRDVFQMADEGLLPNETANYVPKFMAALIIINNPELVQ